MQARSRRSSLFRQRIVAYKMAPSISLSYRCLFAYDVL